MATIFLVRHGEADGSQIDAEAGLPLTAVEFDRREWLPDSTLSWQTLSEVRARVGDYEHCDGEWPAGPGR